MIPCSDVLTHFTVRHGGHLSIAGLSLDGDSVARYMESRGHPPLEPGGEVYRAAIPRMLDLLDRYDAKCTFFLIADEARDHPDVVREIAWRGHEVASHSMTYPLPFWDLPEASYRAELEGSRRLLERLAGVPVEGFRAPGRDVPADLIGALVRNGYLYDASVCPSPLLLLRRANASAPARVSLRAMFGPTRPHVLRRGLAEIPTCTTPGLRLPYCHAARHLAPGPAWAVLRQLVSARRGPITYQLDAVDLLGVEEDELDRRIDRYPGMRLSLERKLTLVEAEIGWLARRRRIVPLRSLAADVLAQSGSGLEPGRTMTAETWP